MMKKPTYEELEQRIQELEKADLERKEILREKEFSESEKIYRVIVELSPDGITIHDSGMILFANDGFAKIAGLPKGRDVIGKSLSEFAPDEPLSEERQRRHEKFLFDNEVENMHEVPVLRREGGLSFVQVSSAAINYKGKKAVLSIHRDITRQKKMEQALIESEERYKKMFEHAGVGITLIDAETLERVQFNTKAHDQLGQTREEYQANKAFQTEVEKDQEGIENHFKRIIEKGWDVYETKRMIKGGEIREFLSSSIPLKIGGRIFIHNIRTDITEQKRLEEQLQQARKMESIGNLAGGIAHDFNNILSPIMVHSEMAMMELPEDSSLRFSINEIYKAGERARDLVKQILVFSRKGESRRVKIKITPIVNEGLKMLRSFIPTTIEINHNIRTESDTILADPTQVHQLLLNLGTNAAHAMREKGGILSVSLEQEDITPETVSYYSDLVSGSYLKLTVSDTGTGIDDSIIKRIFEPYFTTKAPGDGTGMGLAVVHGIVKKYGGDIMVESERGKGTTFKVYLPLIESDVPEVKEYRGQLPGGSERILLVDDEKAGVEAVRPMLESLGYKVTSTISSLEAFETFQNNPELFDLVITDMTMPGMTGGKLAREAMSIRPDIPVIICTGFSEQMDANKAKEMGIRAFVMKPVVMREMADTIRKVLDSFAGNA
jgi:PAS domain S-box-containing protein